MDINEILEELRAGVKAWPDLTAEEAELVFNHYAEKPGSIERSNPLQSMIVSGRCFKYNRCSCCNY